MDGFIGVRDRRHIARATAVMDPFHLVALAGLAVGRFRQRVQRHLHAQRGQSGDPLQGVGRAMRTGASLITDCQHTRLLAV